MRSEYLWGKIKRKLESLCLKASGEIGGDVRLSGSEP